MTETIYIFDEYDEYFRSPGGAVKAPGSLRLRLKIKRGESAGASVVYHFDGDETLKADMRFAGVTGSYDIYESELRLERSGLYWYHFEVYLGKGTLIVGPEHMEGGFAGGFQITIYDPGTASPDWIRGGVIYHIFVDRFHRGGELRLRPGAVFRDDWGGCPDYLPDENGIVHNNDFFGGDFDGIIEKLPYLEELGVTCIYLSPVFEAASNHKYDTGDFMKIDPAFGGDEAFERLCSAAIRRGIRIILDGVFNHVGVDSRYFNKYGGYEGVGAYQSSQSPYYDWFTFREWNSVYDSWWGIELLPALNKYSESYKEFICGEDGVIAHWTNKGVSGWRLDVADELPDAFLYPLCEAIKRENGDAFIVGEVWEDASNKISYGARRHYLLGGQLDSVTNYPLKDAIIACVKDKNVEELARVMSVLCQNYPENVLNSLMNILGTHDTMRILTVLGGVDFPQTKEAMANYRLTQEQRDSAKKLLKLASALQFTLPGTPCVYYGDEAGMDGGADPFNRRCYPWGSEDHELISWYTGLARLRKRHACLKDGKYKLIQACAGVFAFTRGQGRERILMAVNVSDGDRDLVEDEFNYDLLRNEYVDRIIVKGGSAAIYAIMDRRR